MKKYLEKWRISTRKAHYNHLRKASMRGVHYHVQGLKRTKFFNNKASELWKSDSWRCSAKKCALKLSRRKPGTRTLNCRANQWLARLFMTYRDSMRRSLTSGCVSDAFIGAGMGAMFRVAAVPLDSLAELADLQEMWAYPLWLTNAAWTALRRSVGSDQAAYASSMSVASGDVLALLRSLRAFYERRAVPLLTQLRKDLIKVNISDYPDFKHYVAALELIFSKLAAPGDIVTDNVRRFHLACHRQLGGCL